MMRTNAVSLILTLVLVMLIALPVMSAAIQSAPAADYQGRVVLADDLPTPTPTPQGDSGVSGGGNGGG